MLSVFVRVCVFGVQDQALEIVETARTTILCVRDKGPCKAMKDLAVNLDSDQARAIWAEAARLAAIVGSCPKSIREAKSGMRVWIWFARHVLGIKGSVWALREQDIMAWSNMFRNKDTFSTCLGYVRTGCMMGKQPTDVLRSSVVKRAKLAIAKREQFAPREKQFVQRPLLVKVMKFAKAEHSEAMAMLFLAAYVFLLRVPSEGIPMRRGGDGARMEEHKSVFSLEGDKVSGHLLALTCFHACAFVRLCLLLFRWSCV